jgi:phage tail-like protein
MVGTQIYSQHGILSGFRFRVSVPAFSGEEIGFMRVSGLSADISPLEWKEITNPVTAIKLPNEISSSDVVLERGLDSSGHIARWWGDVISMSQLWGTVAGETSTAGILQKWDVQIGVYGKGQGNPLVKIYTIYNAWPRAIKVSDFDSMSSGLVIQSLTLANEGIDFAITQ